MRGAVAITYAVLEVNRICENSHPTPPKPLDQFRCRFMYITKSAQGVHVPNLIKIDSAVAALRMREKQVFAWVFCLQRAQCSHCKRCISYSNSVCPSVPPPVCLSVRLSVTRRYCVKTTARSTVQFALLDSKMCLVL